MANNIIINDPIKKAVEKRWEAIRAGAIPIMIKCPDCSRIYTLFIQNFDQGLHTLLGQACPFCKRFIKETDDPDKLLVDAKEIREAIKEDK